MTAIIESVAGVPKSDAMDELVDVVRGEGRTTGRKPLPLALSWRGLCARCVRVSKQYGIDHGRL
jgi:hypothetical protein